ncbi:MAG: hypothetical protein C0482_21980 [Gordonia sp.]|nr:hypothetical protein [Gordonia sp. (in: high G+C Gram-positive bacteria)]
MIDHPQRLTWPREVLHRAQFQHHKAAQTMTGAQAGRHGLVAAILYSCDPRWWTNIEEHTDEALAALICQSLDSYLKHITPLCPPVAHWLKLVHTQLTVTAGNTEGPC